MSPVLLPFGRYFFSRRIASIHADLVLQCSVLGAFVIFSGFRALFFYPTQFNSLQEFIDPFNLTLACFFLFSFLLKDCIGSRSYGKRYAGFVIIAQNTYLPVNNIKLLIRNFTLLLPFEWLFVVFGLKRRFGDFLIGTVLIDHEPDSRFGLASFYFKWISFVVVPGGIVALIIDWIF